MLGAHDADVDALVARVVATANAEIARCYLRRDRHLGGWTLVDGGEVAGRLTFDPDGGSFRVVVDGRELSWDELGHALGAYEGGGFRLRIEDRCEDLRSDAQILTLPAHRPQPRPDRQRMLLRCTAKLLTLLRVREPTTAPAGADDWCANLLWLDGRKCLLLTHAGTLFPILVADVRAAQLRPLGPWLVTTIAGQLRSERLPPDALGALDPDQVSLAKTASRHVLGVMNDMATYAEAALASAGRLATCDVEQLNHCLRRGLHQRDGHYVTPLDLVAERLHRTTSMVDGPARS